MNKELYSLKERFLTAWPIEKLQTMKLEEYTDTKRENSFCYWLEHITRDLGSIVGGSSYKFGIYKMGTTTKKEPATNNDNDGIYAWHTKYNITSDTAQEAFENIKNNIITIATLAINNDINEITKIDIGDAYKWKIAFLYNDYNIINIFKKEAIRFVANSLYQIEEVPDDFKTLNSFLLSKKENEDYFSYTKKLWEHYDANNSKAEEFKKWLKNNNAENSNKSSSYISAIKIIITVFKIDIYTETNTDTLQEVYEDFLENQKEENGKYAYEKKSYGKKGFYSAAIKAYIQFLKNDPISIVSEEKEEYKKITEQNQLPMIATNQILYGPPGTGKTYATKKLAVELIDKHIEEDRNNIIERYNELEETGQIVFTTFHQSMSYEDFVEGIKPKTSEDKKITYEIEDGIFKQIANKAKGLKGKISSENNTIDFENKNYFKMSIGGKNRKDVHNWCIENNFISLGWGDKEDYSEYNNIKNWETYKNKFKDEFSYLVEESKYHIQAMFIFQKMKIGDIVLVSLGNHIIDAIGIITGEYEYKEQSDIPYHHFRKVDWLATNLDANPSLFVDKKISQQSIYQFYNDDINVDYFKQTFSNNKVENTTPKNHVLIIDEINRGNVSAIFGELITLLEPDKRLGQDEAITVTLPYSKTIFGIPSNLHIIGTMNTADRSIEALDTALRRRFTFKETPPIPSLLKTAGKSGQSNGIITLTDGSTVNLENLLTTINNRIEKLIDKDHKIGHSYFLKVDSEKSLKNAFKNKVIPLLEEYFFGDFGKIGLVLGDSFIDRKDEDFNFSQFKHYDSDIVEDLKSKITYKITNDNLWNFNTI